MKHTQILPFIFLLMSCYFMMGQAVFGVQFPIENREQKCRQCMEAFRNKPKEVLFSIKRDDREGLYFEINSKEWAYQLFKDTKDGIMIDIVSKDRYDCATQKLEPSSYGIVGDIKKPIYAATLKKGLKKQPNGKYRVKVGVVPVPLRGKELEFNIYFINDNYFCRYNRFYDLKSYRLELLDMGMYLDSLTYQSEIKDFSQISEGFKLKYKTLKFTIPFEKNKATYATDDIKPVYDSLHLTDYTIKTIDIKAYASVEGSLKRNIALQEGRAASIVEALQEFQKPAIKTKISATENWVEFLNTIPTTEYASFSDLSKAEIKAKLMDPNINADLEPYLQKHRKAVITLSLQKKDSYKTMSNDQLISLYKNAVLEENIEKANELQNTIFERIKGNEISPDKISTLDVPAQKQFVQLANKNTSLTYMINEREVLRTYTKLLELDRLLPRNKKIKYNICATKFKIWRHRIQPVKTEAFKKEILALKNYGVSQVLIDRMLINYHIIKSESYMRKRDFAAKDKSMKYIYTRYKKIVLTNDDYLNLAQYFTSYANIEYAIELLKDRVKSIDAGTDLLFYYLNLTLVDKELTKERDYRTMMLNAISKDQQRFCKLFDPFGEGGVTFQLLENEYLRKAYCENCNTK